MKPFIKNAYEKAVKMTYGLQDNCEELFLIGNTEDQPPCVPCERTYLTIQELKDSVCLEPLNQELIDCIIGVVPPVIDITCVNITNQFTTFVPSGPNDNYDLECIVTLDPLWLNTNDYTLSFNEITSSFAPTGYFFGNYTILQNGDVQINITMYQEKAYVFEVTFHHIGGEEVTCVIAVYPPA